MRQKGGQGRGWEGVSVKGGVELTALHPLGKPQTSDLPLDALTVLQSGRGRRGVWEGGGRGREGEGKEGDGGEKNSFPFSTCKPMGFPRSRNSSHEKKRTQNTSWYF